MVHPWQPADDAAMTWQPPTPAPTDQWDLDDAHPHGLTSRAELCHTRNVCAAPSSRRSDVARVLVVAAGVVATAPVAWWLGDLLNRIGGSVSADEADYVWRPLSLSAAGGAAIGLGALAIVACALAVLLRRVRSGHWQAGWLQVVAAPAMVCSYAGMLVAVATAPVIGANIGAGVMLLGAAPVGLGAAVWLVVALVRLRSTARPRRTEPPAV